MPGTILVIVHQETGVVIPPEDESALAQAMITLFTDLELRRKWGLAARKRVQSEYGWDRVVERSREPIECGLKEYYARLD